MPQKYTRKTKRPQTTITDFKTVLGNLWFRKLRKVLDTFYKEDEIQMIDYLSQVAFITRSFNIVYFYPSKEFIC